MLFLFLYRGNDAMLRTGTGIIFDADAYTVNTGSVYEYCIDK